MTYEEFLALPQVEPFETVMHNGQLVRTHTNGVRMVWLESDEPVGYIIDGYWWTHAEKDGVRVRLRGRMA